MTRVGQGRVERSCNEGLRFIPGGARMGVESGLQNYTRTGAPSGREILRNEKRLGVLRYSDPLWGCAGDEQGSAAAICYPTLPDSLFA